MNSTSLSKRYGLRFYRQYLWYAVLETDLLFFVVIDAMFLTTVKGMSAAQVSMLTFLSLAFSLVIQYPLLKVINKIGNRAAVRLGSIAMTGSAMCITFAPNFAVLLIGGFLKCIAHTLNAMGTAVLKNRLAADGIDDWFVFYQSDANSAASLGMMITSLLCGFLFRINGYVPMLACIFLCFAGVYVSFAMTREEHAAGEIITEPAFREVAKEQKQPGYNGKLLVLSAFAVYTALTGTGLTYMKLNFRVLLEGTGAETTVFLLSIISTIIYLIRVLSNMMVRNSSSKFRNIAVFILSGVLFLGLLLQLLPWIPYIRGLTAFATGLLCIGYLMVGFVRDPFITLVQNMLLKKENPGRQQAILVALNSAKKAGSLVLAAVCTLLLKKYTIVTVTLLMTVVSFVNLFPCYIAHMIETFNGRSNNKN